MLVGILGDWAAFIGAVLILGLGTSWYMIDVGTRLTTEKHGPWVGWTSAGRADADPYTRAHFARLGTLQLTTEIALTYRRLHRQRRQQAALLVRLRRRGTRARQSLVEPHRVQRPRRPHRQRGAALCLHQRVDRPAPRRHLRRDAGARGEPRQLAADRRRRPARPHVHDVRCGNDHARQDGGRCQAACR